MKLDAMTHNYYLIGKTNYIEGSSIQHEIFVFNFVFLLIDSDNRKDKENCYLLMKTIKRTTNKSIPTENVWG